MRWLSLAVAAALAATATLAAPVGAAPASAKTIGCGHQSIAGFPHAFSNPDNLRIGPLAFVDALRGRADTPEGIARAHGVKSPAVLRPGHTAVVSVDRADRSFARLEYSSSDRGRFRRLPHTVRFESCSRSRAGSNVDGAPVTFWSGFFVLRHAPACVGLTVSMDDRRPVHRTLAFARPSCEGA
jgi:hypothetical protein